MSNIKKQKKTMKIKWIIRLFTSKEWRGHKRRVFLERILEELKSGHNATNWGSFSGIYSTTYSYEYACHELASQYDYNPILDKSYSMNIGKKFLKYQIQNFDSLRITITRHSPALKCILRKSGTFSIEVSGRENRKKFNFTYTKTLRIFPKKTSLVGVYLH